MADRVLPKRTTRLFAGGAVAIGTLVLMIATEPRLAIVWDEGHSLSREARIRMWLHALADPPKFAASWNPPTLEMVPDQSRPPTATEIDSRSKLLSARNLHWFWPFAREEPHGHPPFYAIVGMLGDVFAPSWSDLPKARLGPIIVFSLTAGAIFSAFFRRGGIWPATAAAGAWVFQPQLFALGHYAGYDAILSALWVGAILAFARAVESENRWPGTILFGMLAGWAADTKLTGWFVPFPFIAWTLLARSRRGFWTLFVGGMVAVLTLYVFNPAWWADPVGGLNRFFASNLSRAKTVPIPIMFLGEIYQSPAESLPWFNTLVWTVIAAPVGFLLLAIMGVFRAIKERKSSDPLAVLVLFHWAFLLILRALPHTPGHDGVRQILPAFGCLALASGVGATIQSRWMKALIVAAILEGAISIAVMMPVPLSYFSPIVGGLPGASKIGMEPTYFWDALTQDAWDQLAAKTPKDQTVAFATFPMSWLHLKRLGTMRVAVYKFEPGPPAWYIVQNRPGQLHPVDKRLIKRMGPKCVLVSKLGVPLIWAFPGGEYLNEMKPARGQP